MKRRNADCGKLRRPNKRNKITDNFNGSTWVCFKFFLVWAVVLLLDYILEFRFEFMWPFWLFIRSVYDSHNYQGGWFSFFFVCIAMTSDMFCYFFIPVQWLFFAASTYVWVQYVWHTEKGICVPTMILWFMFVYMESAVRFRDVQHLPYHLDLCRPFAAHCIGYPVVTLGFGFRSYVGFRMRQRKQREVMKENEFIRLILLQALPVEQPLSVCHNTPSDKNKEAAAIETSVISNGIAHNSSTQVKNSHRKSLDKGERDKTCVPEAEHKSVNNKTFLHTNGDIHTEHDFTERTGSVNEFNENEAEKDKSSKLYVQLKQNSKWSNHHVKENGYCQRDRKNKANKENTDQHCSSHKDDYCQRLEGDVKRLKIDLQASRQSEQELRYQVNALLMNEKSVKSELCQLQLDNDELQSKLQSLVSARQVDKQTITQLERRLRQSSEAQLAAERKAKEAAARAAPVKGECTESCRVRRRDMEVEAKQMRRDIKTKEERCLAAEREIQCLQQYKDNHNESEILMSALSAMQDKNAHLENSLSAETRIKLDLFSALGEAKRQLEIRENMIRQQDREMEELKGKMAQVLAVMPTESFNPAPICNTSILRLADSPSPSAQSNLDPNATVYTPKSSHMAPAAEA